MWAVEAVIVVVFVFALFCVPQLMAFCGHDYRAFCILGGALLAFALAFALVVSGLRQYGYIPVHCGCGRCGG